MKRISYNGIQILLGVSLAFGGIHFLYAQASLDTALFSGENTITKTATTSTGTTTIDVSGTVSSGVIFIDIIPPVLKIIGGDVLYVKAGAVYTDLGAQAYDNVDGDVSSHIITENNVNTGIPGVYHVMYWVQDRAGNKAQAQRTVYVVAADTAGTVATTSVTTRDFSPNGSPESMNSSGGSAPTNEMSTGVKSDVSIGTQTDNSIKIMQENNIQKIEAEKQRIIKNFTEEATKRIASTTKTLSPDNQETTHPVQESPEVVQEKTQKVLERVQTTTDETHMDSDHDGISDYDEKYIYGTDPYNPDTDGDGYSDGSEILGGFDPKNPDLHGTISYESPRDAAVVVKKDILAATSISVVKEDRPDQNAGKPKANKIEFKGIGPPNSFVTLYIYSIPMVITVRTDAEGNWQYTLDKELPDGNHELYVTMTDNAGKILAKSSPIPFVKEANAITVDQNLLAPLARGQSPSLVTGGWVYATVTVIISTIGVILTIIGMRTQPYPRRYAEEIKREDDPTKRNYD